MSYTLSVGQQQIEPVTDFQYLGSMIASPVEDLKQRRGLAWAVFWKLETIWHSTTLSTNTKLRLFDSLSSCPLCHMDLKTGLWMLKWRVINSFATSAYRIMTGVKWLDINKVRNSVVLDSVSRNDLIHTFLSRQLRFLGHLLRSDHALYALYEPTHGKTRRGRPCTNYITCIQKITGHQLSKLIELAQNRNDWCQLVVECATQLEEDNDEWDVLQIGCPSSCSTNSVKVLKALWYNKFCQMSFIYSCKLKCCKIILNKDVWTEYTRYFKKDYITMPDCSLNNCWILVTADGV